MWSAGISYFEGGDSRQRVVRKILLRPRNIGVYIGIAMMAGSIPMPESVMQTIRTTGGCTTAVSIFFIGKMLAEADSFHEIMSRDLCIYCIVQLIFIFFCWMPRCVGSA